MADFKTEHYGAQGETHEGWKSDCPRCTAPGAAFIEDIGKLPAATEQERELTAAAERFDDRLAAKRLGLIGPDERDARADTDTGLYYCVSASTGALVTRHDRPVHATLAEWKKYDRAVRGAAYLPACVTYRSRSWGPLFGSLPLLDTSGTPDVVGDLVKVLGALDSVTKMLADRGATLDTVLKSAASGVEDLGTLISQRIHFVELLDCAAKLIDPDSGTSPSYEEQLDWLAKWRETVGR